MTAVTLCTQQVIASFFGVTRGAVYHWRNDPSFPRPAQNVLGCSVWDIASVQSWHEAYVQAGSRPRK